MNFRLKRWFRYIVILIIVLILCWQNSSSSENLTNSASRTVSAICIFFGGHTTASGIYWIVRKIGHFLAFTVLSTCGHLAISGDANDFKSAAKWSAIVNLAVALLGEIAQAYALDRCATLKDAFINLSGAALGILIGICIEDIRQKRHKHPSHIKETV